LTTSFLTALRLLAISMVSFHRDCIFNLKYNRLILPR
jgi:hypothetical protein